MEGPKGVGKSLTAEQRARVILRLDDRAVHELVRADPALALKTALRDSMPVLIDEWQRAPEIWDAVRRAVDADRTGGQYLLTGSASPDKPNTHSGAGRIASLRMRPMALCERDVDVPTVSLSKLLHSRRRTLRGSTDVTIVDYTREILASGFPGLRELTGRARRVQRDGHLKRIVDHGVIRNNLRRGDGRRARKAGQDHEYCVSRSARASVDRRCRAGMVACAEYDVPAASATIPTMAAQNGNSTAPATPAVNARRQRHADQRAPRAIPHDDAAHIAVADFSLARRALDWY